MQIYFHDNPKKKIRKEGSNTKLGNKKKKKKWKNEKINNNSSIYNQKQLFKK